MENFETELYHDQENDPKPMIVPDVRKLSGENKLFTTIPTKHTNLN